MRTPALATWHHELKAGKRTTTMFDALFRAACEEQNALEAAPALQAGYLRTAREIIEAARKGRAA